MVAEVDGLSFYAERLQKIDEVLDKILDGEKVYLDPDVPEDKVFIDQIHAFYPEDFDKVIDRALDSPPKAYYITPDIAGTDAEAKRKEISTKVHPLHERLINSNEIFLRNCSKLNGIHNVIVAGADLHFRDRRDYQQAFDRSQNLFVHKRGDVVSLSQTVKLLRQIVEGQDKTARSVVLDNTLERYTPVLGMLGLGDQDGVDLFNDTLKSQGIETRLGLVDVKGTSISKVHEIGVDLHRKLPVLPPLFNHNLFFDTSSDEKIKDTTQTVRANRSNVEIKPALLLCGHSEHDPEFTWSFGGNALAKGITTLKDKLASPDLEGDLEKSGIKKEEAFLLFADGGEYYEEKSLRDLDTMAHVKELTHPDTEYPGSETKPWSQGFGTKADTYVGLSNALRECEQINGHKAATRSADNCVAVVIPVQQDDLENPRYYAVKAASVLQTVFEPRPAHHIHYTQRHFQRFEDCDETLAEMEEECDTRFIEKLAISKAMRGLVNAARVPKNFRDLRADFNAAKDMKVVCPWPVDGLEKANLGAMLERNGMCLKELDKPVESFDDIRRVMHKSKALFFPNIATGAKENFWMSRILLPASILVGKQLRDPKVNGNPMVMFSEGLGRRSEFEEILDHLKKSGMITQDLHFLYNRSGKMSSAMRYIKEQASFHPQYEEYQHHKYKALPPVERAVVSYLLSASSAYRVDNDNAYKGAVNCALNGFDLSSGMGSGAPMGWHVMGGLQAIREGFRVNVQGVQDPHAMKTEGWPLQEMHKFMGEGHAVVAPDIFVRIWQILELEKLRENEDMEKIVVTQANGIGGLQEIASHLALKEAGIAGTERTFMIIENTPRATASGTVYRPHDALIDLLDRRGELHAENGIFVTKDPRETNDLIGKLTGKEMIYYDVERPADTLFPFAREKNPFYDWFMHPEGRHKAPAMTIRDEHNRVHAQRQHQPEIYLG